jgi:HSP20 family molecular chaperone IbpA
MVTIMTEQELQVQQKREVDQQEESTSSGLSFLPVTDIFETPDALRLVLEVPGVSKDSVEVGVENNVLTITGRIDFTNYEGLQPLYTEYNIGHYSRSFRLSNEIEQERITAELSDGVMTLVLPKAAKARPRRIKVDLR